MRPALRGEGGDAYAVTEAEAGSDPGGIASTAVATDGGWRINGEKWFVTSGDVARVLIVMANVVDGAELLPTLFLIEPDAPGVDFVDDPKFTHNYPHGHPTIRFTDVEVAADAVIGGVGNGLELQRAWFTEERLGIATHGLGAMWRLLEETLALDADAAPGRHADPRLPGDLVPARRLGDRRRRRPAAGAERRASSSTPSADLKLIHAKASMAKLFVSEAAGRCADRAVQAFGGRGYMRSNVAERFNRELRVDRIWEGTNEIQRLIVDARTRAARRRGDDPLTVADLARLLRPRSVAVVGATDRAGSYAAQALINLDAIGFPGEVWGVNPGRTEVLGRPCVPSLADLPEAVDAVIVAIPAAGVPEVIEQAGARGCGGAVVFSAGFARDRRGRGARARAGRRRGAARAAGLRPELQRDRRGALARGDVGRRGCARASPAPSRSSRRAATSRSTRSPRSAGCASTP